MLTLYYAPGTIASAVAIALNEAGADYDKYRINFRSDQQRSDDYLAVNPKGRVPALATDRGIITETAAILDYIAAVYPRAGLVPDDPYDAARMRGVMGYLGSTAHVNHAHGMRGPRWADNPASWADMKAKVTETMSQSCDYVETHALDGPFVLGDRFSLADPHLFAITTWLAGDGVDIASFPKLARFQKTMWARPSVGLALNDGFL